jgi:hypothetical protein
MRRSRLRLAVLVALAYLLNATYCPCTSAFAEDTADRHQCCPPKQDNTKHATDTHSHVDGCQHCSLTALTSSSGEAIKAPALAPSIEMSHLVPEGLRADRRTFGSHCVHGLAPPRVLPPLVRNARLQI